MTKALDALVELLDLGAIEIDHFRGGSLVDGRQRVFGGQGAGQALVAAGMTVDRGTVHSLLAYFLRAGDPAVAMPTCPRPGRCPPSPTRWPPTAIGGGTGTRSRRRSKCASSPPTPSSGRLVAAHRPARGSPMSAEGVLPDEPLLHTCRLAVSVAQEGLVRPFRSAPPGRGG